MKKLFSVPAVFFAALCCLAITPAQAKEMLYGKWEISETLYLPGVEPVSQVSVRCLSEENEMDPEKAFGIYEMRNTPNGPVTKTIEGCTMDGTKKDGRMDVKAECEGVKTKMEMNFNDKYFSIRTTGTMEDVTTLQQTTGKWLAAECE